MEVARRCLGKYSYTAIAEEVAKAIGSPVDRRTVAKDIKEWEAIWRKELVEDPQAAKAEELARLNDMELEAVEQYALTKRASWWDRRLRIVAQRIALLGLDEPTKVDMDVSVHDDADPRQTILDAISRYATRASADGGTSVPLN